MSESVNVSLTASDSSDVPDLLPPVTLNELPDALQNACARAGWNELMPVQSHALPYLLNKKDIMVQSRTGSGKTGTYLLPLLASLDPDIRTVQALVLVPTRELAVQVEHEATTLLADTGLSVLAVYGGVGYDKQISALKRGVSLVVGTPGRILDHLMSRVMRLDGLRELIFDEADRMLSIGFYPDMKEIQRYLPDTTYHATLFSATYPPHVLRLANEFLRDPELLSLSGDHVHVAEVEHQFCECKSMDKDRALLRLIQTENPTSAIIFCNTKANVHYITSVLQGFGVDADELSADLPQNKREKVLDRLRRGEICILAATDVAARGIDIPALSHVFLYEPPEDHEAYIHRAGRTGRAGAAGTVISLVDVMQKLELDRIAAHYHIPLTQISVPSEESAAQALSLRILAKMENTYRNLGALAKERISQLEPLARILASNEEHLPILAMMLDSAVKKAAIPDVPPALKNKSGSNAKSDAKDKNGRTKEHRPKPGIQNRRNTGEPNEKTSGSGEIFSDSSNFDNRKSGSESKKPSKEPLDAPVEKSHKRPAPKAIDGIPAHLAAFIDPEGLDLPEGAEDSLPSPQRPRKPHRRYRRGPKTISE